MSKHFENLRKYIVALSDPINSFESELVQLKVVSHVLKEFSKADSLHKPFTMSNKQDDKLTSIKSLTEATVTQKLGLTKIVQKELKIGYFTTPRTIGDVSSHVSNKYESRFYTSQFSGILLTLVKQGRLVRNISEETGTFLYSSFQEQSKG